jgi:hypothetical protein
MKPKPSSVVDTHREAPPVKKFGLELHCGSSQNSAIRQLAILIGKLSARTCRLASSRRRPRQQITTMQREIHHGAVSIDLLQAA